MKIEASIRILASREGWIGVDLDGTLAFYDKWRGESYIGDPIPEMVDRVKKWLAEGRDVRILTARASDGKWKQPDHPAIVAIEKWCLKHIGQILPITCEKDPMMIEIWDDKAVQVVENTGQPVKLEAAARLMASEGDEAVIESIEDKISELSDQLEDAGDNEKERIKRRIKRLQDEITHYKDHSKLSK